MNDTLDSALDSEDIEEETEEEIEKVLAAIAGETVAQLPEAIRKQKLKQPATSEDAEVCLNLSQEHFFDHFILLPVTKLIHFINLQENADDEEELEEMRARLARVRS